MSNNVDTKPKYAIGDYATLAKINSDADKIADLQTKGASSAYYDSSAGSVSSQTFALTSDMYDTAKANPLTNTHLVRSDITAIANATLHAPANVSADLTQLHADLNATLSGGPSLSSATQDLLITDTQDAEAQANADYTLGLKGNSDSAIHASHVEELDLANKLLAGAPATLTALQSGALGNVQQSIAKLKTLNDQYAQDPSLRDATGAAGEKLAQDVKAAVESLKTSH